MSHAACARSEERQAARCRFACDEGHGSHAGRRKGAAREPSLEAPLAASIVSRVVELIDEPIALTEPSSGLWKANIALVRMLDRSGAPDIIESRLMSLARALPGLRFGAPTDGGVRHDRFDCAASVYEVQSFWLALRGGRADGLGVLRVRRAESAGPDAAARHFGLTRRQLAVARLLSQGLTNTEAARELCLSPHTVRHHVEQILRKVGVRSRARAVAVLAQHMALQRGSGDDRTGTA